MKYRCPKCGGPAKQLNLQLYSKEKEFVCNNCFYGREDKLKDNHKNSNGKRS